MDKKVIVLLCVAGAFILFSFFAPFIFTYDSLFDIDFSQDGPVGDTIGGLMNPFIAIAGVILTFVAFYIQYKANKEQREQFFMALDEKTLQDELKCRDALQLFQFDIANTIEGIEKQCNQINAFCDTLDADPSSEIGCYRIPTLAMERYQFIDRSVLLHSFDLYMNDSNNLHDAYVMLDYYEVGVKHLFDNVYNPRTADIQKIKEDLLPLFINYYESIVKSRKDLHSQLNNLKDEVYHNIELEHTLLTNGGILNVSRLARDLESNGLFGSIMSGYKNLFSGLSKDLKDNIIKSYTCLKGKIEEYKTQGGMLSKEMRKGSLAFEEKLERLKEINELLKESLEQNTPESIRKRHEEKLKSKL